MKIKFYPINKILRSEIPNCLKNYLEPCSDQPGTRPVWSETSLSAWRILGSLVTQWAHSKDSDQMPRLVWVFAGRTSHFVGFVMILVGWLCWGLTSQSTIFQSCRDGAIASWVINQYFRGVKCLAQGHNTAEVGLEPRTSRSGVRHSTTEPPRSPVLSWGGSFQHHVFVAHTSLT